MKDLTIIKQNGGAYIDSREAAELIGKNHKDLLRDIRGYISVIESVNGRNLAPIDFFVESAYTDSRGREKPCYLLSKMGCELCANKLIGEKGILFTAVYVAKFNAMETAERAELEAAIKIPVPRLGEVNACVRIIVPAIKNMGATSERIISILKSAYEPFGICVAADGEFEDIPQTYTVKQIAGMFGIYSHSGNPHAQAVSCILNENIFIGDAHKTVITEDYGNHTGVSVRYDDYAAQSVKDWLKDCSYPSEIYGFERTYRVLYKD